LAKLQNEFSGRITLVTQNIDHLHECGGSKNVFHMHGELLKMRCQESDRVFAIHGELSSADKCECCKKSNNLRPNIVWFGEMPFQMPEIYAALEEADLFVSIGTSAQVYPAAGFVEVASQAYKIEVNLDPTQMSQNFDENLLGKATELLPNLVERLLYN
jgi:NAD-dependent deacetylase